MCSNADAEIRNIMCVEVLPKVMFILIVCLFIKVIFAIKKEMIEIYVYDKVTLNQ